MNRGFSAPLQAPSPNLPTGSVDSARHARATSAPMRATVAQDWAISNRTCPVFQQTGLRSCGPGRHSCCAAALCLHLKQARESAMDRGLGHTLPETSPGLPTGTVDIQPNHLARNAPNPGRISHCKQEPTTRSQQCSCRVFTQIQAGPPYPQPQAGTNRLPGGHPAPSSSKPEKSRWAGASLTHSKAHPQTYPQRLWT